MTDFSDLRTIGSTVVLPIQNYRLTQFRLGRSKIADNMNNTCDRERQHAKHPDEVDASPECLCKSKA